MPMSMDAGAPAYFVLSGSCAFPFFFFYILFFSIERGTGGSFGVVLLFSFFVSFFLEGGQKFCVVALKRVHRAECVEPSAQSQVHRAKCIEPSA